MNNERKIPAHVAIIMDGNGRWAQERGLDRTMGHAAGVEPVRSAVRAALRNGVRYLTLYAFSTENWGRPAQEVDALMELLCANILKEAEPLAEQGVRVRIIGNRKRFSQKVLQHLDLLEQKTAQGDKLTLILALNYSSRSEITDAVQRLAESAVKGELDPSAIDEKTISRALWTSFCPDPDLVIRTSGEYRLSNFLLWQASYAELYFPDLLWPDFKEEDFDKAIDEYTRRDRRFGLIKK